MRSDGVAVGEKVPRFLSNVTEPKCSTPATFRCLKCAFPLSDKRLSGAPPDLSHPSLIGVTLEVCRLGEAAVCFYSGWFFFPK